METQNFGMISINVKQLKRGDIISINDCLCRITDFAFAHPNKRLIGAVNIISGKFMEIIYLTTDITSKFV
jgi:translation elongation factor P/translation initiation factor 5A